MKKICDGIYEGKKLSDFEKELIEYFIDNTTEALKLGVRGVAKEKYTSTSTIMRLSKKLGYSGFVEMLYSFKDGVMNFYGDSSRIELTTHGAFRVREKSEIDGFLEILKNGKIGIYGEGFSELAARYIYQKLIVLGIDAVHIIAMNAKMIEKSKMKIDMLLVVSKSGETHSNYELCEAFKQVGTKISSFTGRSSSRISKISDFSFTFEDKFKQDDEVFYPNPFFGYCIAGFEELIRLYFERNKIS